MGKRKKKGGGGAQALGSSKRKRERKSERRKLKRSGLKASAAPKDREEGSSLYTVEEYLSKVDELVDSFQLDLAVQFCERALELEPENVRVLDTLAPLLLEVGDTEQALELFQQAVKLSPSEGAAKYLYLGQLTGGLEAVAHITKGIEILKKDVEGPKEKASEGTGEEGQNREELSAAYCALAEVYLTDACFEEDAGERCYDSCCQAVLMCPRNPEAHQLKASCLLSQLKPEEAKEALMKGLSLWLPSLLKKGEEEEERGSGAEASQEDDMVEMPSYSSRIGVAKVLLELEENDLAFEVLEGLLGEDDEVVGVWYLMGWLHYLLGDADSARFYLEQMQTLYAKLCCDEEEILVHAQDILKEIGLSSLEEVKDVREEENDEETGTSKKVEEDQEEEGDENETEEEDAMDIS